MPEEKIVYDPKEHAENQKNAGDKKVTEKDIVYSQHSATTKPKKPAENPKATKPTKTKKKNAKNVVDAEAHAEDGADVEPDERVTEFRTKVNKYGFLHVPKRAWSSLPFKIEEPLIARIEGKTLVIAASTK